MSSYTGGGVAPSYTCSDRARNLFSDQLLAHLLSHTNVVVVKAPMTEHLIRDCAPHVEKYKAVQIFPM